MPAHWFTPPDRPGLRARLLAPLGAIRARVMARRLAACTAWRAPVPVICTGTLAAGNDDGPALEVVVAHLQRGGHAPAILMQSPAASAQTAVRVDPRRDDAGDVGAAALIAAACAPTWIASDRAEGAQALVAAQAADAAPLDCILMPDALREGGVMTDIGLAVVDASRGFGNGLCLPAGPMYEPLQAGLARADLLLSIGPRAAQQRFRDTWGRDLSLPVVCGTLRPLETGMAWHGARVLSFAGPGQSDALPSLLRALGAEVIRHVTIEETGRTGAALFARLTRDAALVDAQLVTTETVAARLPAEMRANVLALPLRLSLEERAPLERALTRVGLPVGS